jgi:hypothetical protein
VPDAVPFRLRRGPLGISRKQCARYEQRHRCCTWEVVDSFYRGITTWFKFSVLILLRSYRVSIARVLARYALSASTRMYLARARSIAIGAKLNTKANTLSDIRSSLHCSIKHNLDGIPRSCENRG